MLQNAKIQTANFVTSRNLVNRSILHMSDDPEEKDVILAAKEPEAGVAIVNSSLDDLISGVTGGEWEIILNIVSQAKEKQEKEDALSDEVDGYVESSLEALVAEALPRFDPKLVMTMKKIAAMSATGGISNDNDDEKMNAIVEVSNMLEYIMNQRLQSGRDLLKSFLDAGEIRKLDSLIGKAQRENRLDMAFFTVLNMNIKDAFDEAQEEGSGASVSMGGVPMTEFASQDSTPEQGSGANRLQILQHVYTRCQEEVEKAVQPGVGLLNKLLRTEMPAIRKNQLQHYLSPQSSLTLPDGKVIPLQTTGNALVPPMELVSAMTSAVDQIRQVENAGGTDRKTAADLVESIRQLAIEARLTVIEAYGESSQELNDFQNGLQPVFRPGQKLSSDDE